MILKTRHGAEYVPFISILTRPIDGGWTEGAPIVGTFSTYVERTQPEYYNEYTVTTNAGTIENLSPLTLDLADFPVVKRAAGFVGSSGNVRFTRNGVGLTRSFNIATVGQPQVFQVPVSLTSSTLLSYFHNLAFGAASAVDKNDFYYRTVGGSGVAVLQGNTYTTVQPNPDCWAAGWDFSGVPIWNSSGGSGGGSQHGGALITNNGTHAHLIEAEHFRSPVGSVFRFMKPDGSLAVATSIGVNSRPSGATNLETQQLNEIPGDSRVHLLRWDSGGSGVASYPVAGPWIAAEAVTGSVSSSLPWQTAKTVKFPLVCIYLDQSRRAYFLGSYASDCKTSTYSVATTTWNGSSISLDYAHIAAMGAGIPSDFATALGARHRAGISGDSGSALFTPLSSSSLALATCFTSPLSGPYFQQSRLNALIASADTNAGVSTGLTVTVAPDPTL